MAFPRVLQKHSCTSRTLCMNVLMSAQLQKIHAIFIPNCRTAQSMYIKIEYSEYSRRLDAILFDSIWCDKTTANQIKFNSQQTFFSPFSTVNGRWS